MWTEKGKLGEKSSHNKTRWKYVALLSVVWIVVCLISSPMKHNDSDAVGYIGLGGSPSGITPSLTAETTVVQSFSSPQDGLREVKVLLATYARVNNSCFNITLRDDAGETIYEEIIQASELKDNSNYVLEFPTQESSGGHQYQLIVQGIDGDPDNSPTIWVGQSSAASGAVVNGVEQSYSLIMEVGFQQRNLYLVFFAIIFVASYGVVFWLAIRERKLENTFLVLSVVMGILFVVINPFPHRLDEDTHFFKSYTISQGDFCQEIRDGQVGNDVSVSVADYTSFGNFSLTSNLHLLKQPISTEEVYYVNSHASSIIPLAHCVSALGIGIARLLGASYGVMVIAGRLANYLAYTALCYYAIKQTKYYKSVFFTIACLPAALWMAGSFSTDPVLLGAALLLVATCFKYTYQDDEMLVSTKDTVCILLCGLLVISLKSFVYSPLALCFFLIPKSCFRKKQWGITIGAAMLIVFLAAFWQNRLSSTYASPGDSRGGDTDTARQIRFILGDPLLAVKTFVNYYRTTVMNHLTAANAPGTYTAVSGLFSILCILSATIANDKYPLSVQKRRNTNCFFVICFCSMVFLSTLAMYLMFTPVGSIGIEGVQTRYFFPPLVLLMCAFANNEVKNNSKNYSSNLSFMMIAFLTIQLILQLNSCFA